MLKIIVKDEGSIDKALKKWKKKFRDTKQMDMLRKNKEHTKPSVKRRDEIQSAKYRQQKNNNND